MLDAQGLAVTWNKSAERINDYRAGEIIGQDSGLFYTEVEKQAARPHQMLETARAQQRYEEKGRCGARMARSSGPIS